MIAILIYLVLVIPIGIFLFARIVKNSRFSDFCKRFRKTDPQMTAEEFEAEVQSRIRTYFLSEGADNIRFVSGVQPERFADVVDVRIQEYRQIATVPNPDFLIGSAHAVLDLVRVKDGKLVREKGKYSFDIYRAASAKTELRTDKEIFTVRPVRHRSRFSMADTASSAETLRISRDMAGSWAASRRSSADRDLILRPCFSKTLFSFT